MSLSSIVISRGSILHFSGLYGTKESLSLIEQQLGRDVNHQFLNYLDVAQRVFVAHCGEDQDDRIRDGDTEKCGTMLTMPAGDQVKIQAIERGMIRSINKRNTHRNHGRNLVRTQCA